MQSQPTISLPPGPSRLRKRFLVASVLATALLAIGTFIVCWRLAKAAVAPTHFALGPPPADLPCESLTLDSDSGAKIATWRLSADHSRGVVVLAHPIRGSRLNMIDRAKLLHSAGYSVVMIDLRGHGESTGDTITLGYLERHDVRAAVAFARKEYPGLPIAVDGWSLGGAAALMASPLGIDALILEEVYPTVTEAIGNRTRARVGPFAPLATAILMSQLGPQLGVNAVDLCPIDKLTDAGCPVLLLAGTDDLHTTYEQSQRMYDRAVEPKKCVFFKGAAHVDLLKFDSARYRKATLEFLDAHMPQRSVAADEAGSSDD